MLNKTSIVVSLLLFILCTFGDMCVDEDVVDGIACDIRDSPSWLAILKETDIYVDLIFLLDGSGSVDQTEFSILKEWIADVSHGFNISNGRFQIGVVQFSHWYRARHPNNQALMKTEVILGSCTNHDCLRDKLNSTTLMGYTTFTGFAINKTVKEDFKSSRNFGEAKKIMVLVTDGISQDDVTRAAAYARSQNITIFPVGIGEFVDLYELRLIATGSLYSNLQIYPLDSYAMLPNIVGSLQSEIKSYYNHPVCPPLSTHLFGTVSCNNMNNVGSTCTLTCNEGFKVVGESTRSCHITPNGILWTGMEATCAACDKKFDLLLMLDSSKSVQEKNFEFVKKFIQFIISVLPIGPNAVQVSCIRYNQVPTTEFDYDTHMTKEKLLEAMGSIEYSGRGTLTGKALKYAAENKFSPDVGRRLDIPHITLLITDGEAKDNISDNVKFLQRKSRVIAIGLKRAHQGEIELITSDPDIQGQTQILPDYCELLSCERMRNTVERFCNAVDAYENTTCQMLSKRWQHGTIVCNRNEMLGQVPVGTLCTLSCAPGYQTPGEASAQCNYLREWTKTNWRCIEKIHCEPLQEELGVQVLCPRGSRIDSTCKSRCRPGYSLIATEKTSHCEMLVQKVPETYECVHTCDRISYSDPKWSTGVVKCNKTEKCDDAVCSEGNCVKANAQFFCKCNPGYYGAFCNNEIDECKSVTCENGGSCIDLINGYRCDCEKGFTGMNCSDNTNECLPNPCLNGGNCTDGINKFNCTCQSGYYGSICQKVDYCSSAPCKNGANCSNSEDGFTCDCEEGFNGTQCEQKNNGCVKNACNEGSNCHDQSDNCGYCEPNPCRNDGNCSVKLDNYSCECTSSYTGENCTEDVDECDIKPAVCHNGAECENTYGDFKCLCAKGYWGKHCSENICQIPRQSSVLGKIECVGFDMSSVSKPLSVCEVMCPEGWHAVVNRDKSMKTDHVTLHCDTNGKWSNSTYSISGKMLTWRCELITCQPLEGDSSGGALTFLQIEKASSFPGDPELHIINCTNGTNVGSSCHLNCHDSFEAKRIENESLVKTCLADGTWSGFQWECLQTKCLRPLSAGNIGRLNCSYSVGSVCDLECPENSKASETTRKQCTSNLEWEPDSSWGCREKMCPTLLDITNGDYLCSDGERPGSVCEVVCLPGYVLKNGEWIVCEEVNLEMSWTGPGTRANCVRSKCDFSFDLQKGTTNRDPEIDFVSTVLSYTPEIEDGDALLACSNQAILKLDVNEGETINVRFWYGRIIAGFHTVVSNTNTTDGYKTSKPNENLLTSVGTQLLAAGFIDPDLKPHWPLSATSYSTKVLPILTETDPSATLAISSESWKWKSRGFVWTGNIAHGNRTRNFPASSSVYLGLNRVPNVERYYDIYRKGSGLCSVCIWKN